MEVQPESPIPPTPPREKTPKKKPDSPVVEVEEDPIPNKPPKEESSGKEKTKRRVNRRKQVNKTYMDKDGFMGKIWTNAYIIKLYISCNLNKIAIDKKIITELFIKIKMYGTSW